MRHVLVAASVVGAALTFGPGPTIAQPLPTFDHLKCYKIKDSTKFKATVDLRAFQEQFNVDPQCRVLGKAKLFCVPVEKTVTDSDVSPINVKGQDLTDDRICYKIKCPKADIQPELVTDQFSSREIGKFKVAFLCTPAVKGPPPPTSSTTTTTTTTTTTVPTPCDLQADGTCGGSCPTTTEVCVPNSGTGPPCICIPITPTPCVDAGAPTCNGDCPPAEVCEQVAGTTDCDCRPLQCFETFNTSPQCDGPCPPGQICQVFPAGCDCVQDQPCQVVDPLTGQCGGSCPNPSEVCQTFPTGCDCVIPCTFDATTGTCGGQCPAGQQCVDDGTGTGCQCL